MKDEYEVVVIGGGIIGSAVTFELTRRGITDVLLLEKGSLAAGATGRCAAGIRQQWGSELNAQIALESTKIFEKIEEYTGYDGDCGLTQNGYLLVAYTDEEMEQFTKNLENQHKLGIDSYAVDKEEMLKIVPFAMSFSRSYYVQQTPNGSVILGGAPETPNSDNYHSTWQFLERSCYEMTKMMPILRNLKVVRNWAGFYDMSPDRHPIIDEAKDAKGFYSVCGFSSHGFMVAPRIAILVANHIADRKDDLDITLFSKNRFETGELLVEPAIVEGKE